MLVHQFLMATVGTALLFASPAQKSSVDDDIAEELQEQIDYLRAALKELEIKLAEQGNTNDQLQEIQNEFDQLQYQLQELYRQLDKLAESLQQEFRQKLDQLQSELNLMYKQLSDRITDLEEAVQKTWIDQTVGAIRDGMQNLAAQTFKNVQLPKLYLPQVIQDAYGTNANTCLTIVEFSALLETDELRVYGLWYTYDQLIKDLFTSEGSDCAFRLAWWQQKMKASTIKPNCSQSLELLESKMPIALKSLITGIPIRIRKEKNGCKFEDFWKMAEFTRTFSQSGCDMNIWNAEAVDSKKGELFVLRDVVLGEPLYSRGCSPGEGRCFLSILEGDGEPVWWKPILISNEQVQIYHPYLRQYMATEHQSAFNCYKYYNDLVIRADFYITPL